MLVDGAWVAGCGIRDWQVVGHHQVTTCSPDPGGQCEAVCPRDRNEGGTIVAEYCVGTVVG